MFTAQQIFVGLHGHTTPALLLVIIRLVAHSDLLLLNLAKPFAVNVVNVYPRRRWRRSLPDNLGHCTEQMDSAEQGRRIMLRLHVVEEELCVLMPLACGLGEPVLCCGIVLLHILSQKMQLAQEVLGL